ncbi:ornithine cyclodeaminase family protein [Streptacidiphilus neutrinimicus]|uniref:ornithine cyclodeaminase family protein n=1 Tax=Streptacidiphilus neutrinimicus TaxID=105420 RepID=UPI000A6F50BC|nr:NAD(P)-binding domain-containing protein [Streptacidiphilus neutrinimicus]
MTTEPFLVLDHARTQAALADADALGAALTRALVAVARGEASTPPRIAARTPQGLLGAMPGHVPGLGLAAKLITVFPDPDRAGRSTHRGLVAHFDERDGRLLAVLDAEPLTAVRTAVTATLALRTLARPDARRVAVIGTGTQAAAQLALLTGASRPRTAGRPAAGRRDFEVVVAGRTPAHAAATARRFGVAAAASVEEAVRGADAVLCCTGADSPVISRKWLSRGAHVGSVGGSEGPELDAATIRDASLFVEWAGAAAAAPPAGAHELQGVPAERVTLLGSVLAGSHPGRREAAELTVFKSTGHAALDVAAASVAYASASGSTGAAAGEAEASSAPF